MRTISIFAFLATIAERETDTKRDRYIYHDEERGSAHSGQIRINRDEFLLTDILFCRLACHYTEILIQL